MEVFIFGMLVGSVIFALTFGPNNVTLHDKFYECFYKVVDITVNKVKKFYNKFV